MMRRLPNQPTSELTLFAGIFLKTYHIDDAGTAIPQHAHRWPHLTLVIAGAIRVWRGDELIGDFVAPAAIKIPALAKHAFLTLTRDVAFACIHAVGEAEDVDVAAEHTFEMED